MHGYRITRICLIATLLGLGVGTNAQGVQAKVSRTTDQQRSECRFQRVDRVHWSRREVTRTIRCAVQRWPVSGGASKAIAVARCESGLFWRASNGGNYLGVWQQSARYWPSRQNQFDSRRWHLAENAFNARSNTIVSIRQAHAAGWGAWGCA